MKHFTLQAITLSIFVFFLSIRVCSAEPPLTILYYDRMPFFGQPYSKDEGFINSIVRLILDNANIPYVFEKTPLNRLFEYVKRDGLYCVPGVFKTPERELTYKYSRFPIYQDASPRYVIRQSDIQSFEKINTIKDLLTSSNVLGVIKNYSYGYWVDENIKLYKPKILTVDITDDQSNFINMLIFKRFDYFFSGGEEAYYSTNTNPDSKDLLFMRKLNDAPMGNIRWIIFPITFPEEVLEKINNSIEEVKKSPAYVELISSIMRE